MVVCGECSLLLLFHSFPLLLLLLLLPLLLPDYEEEEEEKKEKKVKKEMKEKVKKEGGYSDVEREQWTGQRHISPSLSSPPPPPPPPHTSGLRDSTPSPSAPVPLLSLPVLYSGVLL